jgi:iron complex transport system substrate-binding protein
VEKIISLNPDYYLMTGSKRPGKGTAIIPFGYNVPAGDVATAFNALVARQGVASIPAVATGHTGALYHHFYNNPYNIVAIETLSKSSIQRCLRMLTRWRITTRSSQTSPTSRMTTSS